MARGDLHLVKFLDLLVSWGDYGLASINLTVPVGEQDGRFLVTEIDDGYLPKFAVITFEADTLLQHSWISEGAGE